MATFNTKKTIYANPSLIPLMGESIKTAFEAEDYEVQATPLSSGGYDISIAKGNTFKAVLGMKTALKVTLTPQDGNIYFEAGVGIFGQQAIPTIISMFFFWPILITQIWGMVNQAQLDDKALEIAEKVAGENRSTSSNAMDNGASVFCTNCGQQISSSAKFCPNCGAKI